jgi:hypothetical protein
VTEKPHIVEIMQAGARRAKQFLLFAGRVLKVHPALTKCAALAEIGTMLSTMTRETFAALAGAAVVSLTIFILSLALTG